MHPGRVIGAEPSAISTSLSERTLWLTVERTQDKGRACRDHTVHDASGKPLLVARAFPWQREIVVRRADDPDDILLILRRAISFPFTGRIDVIDAASGGKLGTLNRNGRVRDEAGGLIGRFADDRSLKRRTAEAVVDAVGTAIVGGDGSVSGASRPDGYTFARDGCIAGRLTRATPPFDVGSRSPPSGLIAWLSRVLPSRFGGARLERRPRAWKFERDVIPEADDPPLTVAAALFAVELSHW